MSETTTWVKVAGYVQREFGARRDGGALVAEVLLDLADGKEARHPVRLREGEGTITIDSPLPEALDADEVMERSEALRFGAIVSEGGLFVVRHRLWLDGLTPELLDRCIFGVVRDSFQISAVAVMPVVDAGELFNHLCS